MAKKINMTALAVAFIFGIISPFFVSVMAMLVSFKIGTIIAKIFVPLSSINGLDDDVIIMSNGFIYAFVAAAVMFARRRFDN